MAVGYVDWSKTILAAVRVEVLPWPLIGSIRVAPQSRHTAGLIGEPRAATSAVPGASVILFGKTEIDEELQSATLFMRPARMETGLGGCGYPFFHYRRDHPSSIMLLDRLGRYT